MRNGFSQPTQLTGSGIAKLTQAIRHVGRSEDVKLEYGEVVTPYPDVSIRLGGRFTLERDDLTLTAAVTDRTVIMRRQDDTTETVTYLDGLKAGERVLVASFNNGQKYVVIDRINRIVK